MKGRTIHYLFVCLIILFLASQTMGQVIEEWARYYSHYSSGIDKAVAVKVDSSGNVYVAGTIDGADSGFNYAVVKYNANGTKLWMQRYSGLSGSVDEAKAMVIDNAGNVYVTGASEAIHADCRNLDYLTIKYDTNGNLLWAVTYDGSTGFWKNSDEAAAIFVDVSGNVYVTGSSKSWNEGKEEKDYLTIKYDADGNEQWVVRYDGCDSSICNFYYDVDYAKAVTADSSGNVYITGISLCCQMLPSLEMGSDFLTLKYDSDGNLLWNERYNGPEGLSTLDKGFDIEVDSTGNVYVAGVSKVYGTLIKYDADGNELWVDRYNDEMNENGREAAFYDMTLDAAGNIYVTGKGAYVGLSGACDYLTIKYDPSGNRDWVATCDGPMNGDIDIARAIALDSAGNVYVTGYSGGGTDFGYLTVKYDNSGNQLWEQGGVAGRAQAIAVDSSGNVHVTGGSEMPDTAIDMGTIKYSTFSSKMWQRNEFSDESVDMMVSSKAVTWHDGILYLAGTCENGSGWLDICALGYDQYGNLIWFNTYGIPEGNDDYPKAIAIDTNNAVYAGAVSLKLNDYSYKVYEYTLLKFGAWTKTIWMDAMGVDIDVFDASLAIDSQNNVYFAGYNFDAKYSSTGASLWFKSDTGVNVHAVQVDEANNVYFAGEQISGNFYIAKYNGSTFELMWESNDYNGAVYELQVDSAGYVYATGYTGYLPDTNFLTIKLDKDGNELWAETYGGVLNGNDYAYGMGVSSNGDVYVTGDSDYSYQSKGDYATLKYDKEGVLQWVKLYDGPANGMDYATALTVDQYNNVYVTGIASNTNSENYSDITTIKYDFKGNEKWAITHNGPADGNDLGVGVKVASDGRVYVVGSADNIDTAKDFAVIKYNQTGADLISIGLAIDDTGSPTANGIIETDEAVDLVGTVFNASYATANGSTGLLSSSDPILINTGTATYPSVISPGTNATCTACYNITAPLLNRPSTHWDITVTDTTLCANCTSVADDYSFHIGNSFADVPPSQIFYSYIEKLFHSGITSGCTTSTYCPSANVQRQHLAKFVCTAMQTASPDSCSAASCTGIFADVPASNPFCPYIEGLYGAGVISGCGSSLFCPAYDVQRQTMSKFICNGMEVATPGSCETASCTGIFMDVPASNPFCGYIEALYNAGVITGCGPSLFCPEQYLARDQMAKILVNAFGLNF
ncbi:MAG: hypothetical protein A2Y62_06160 [Candidatus Fischerbacteria bacterium RBG_13_37_8]|uniref:SLH domain-containing protein n=1 Tax=Candidatus Fischerbacteria bacterium RBG_13_37_8 TaxID=1817863 RepID=A0A1F5VVS0_9BACT|nr:MAG: hypothetical protein A2Y62_06160 [Candidatus Fischerbacteria bacterium RBG_13_37_8]